MDCSAEIDGKRVEFRIHDNELDAIDLSKLSTDAKYAEGIRNSLKQLHYADRNDDVNSWYHPGTSKEVRANKDEELERPRVIFFQILRHLFHHLTCFFRVFYVRDSKRTHC